MEFIINALIKAHPMALIHPERTSAEDQRRIRELTRGHDTPDDYFVDTLARGIARLATTYHPHPAIVRLRDFKTNEYAHLLGSSVWIGRAHVRTQVTNAHHVCRLPLEKKYNLKNYMYITT